ncbi:MAG: DUF167 domain-containing protein [Dehalococcoidia bacterium]
MAHLQVKVTPGTRESAIGEWQDGILRIKVREPAAKGKANEAVVKLLAKKLGMPASAINLKLGATSRTKLLEIEGLSDDETRRRLGAPML